MMLNSPACRGAHAGYECFNLLLLLPLYHFARRFVVDLQAQIFKSDGQMPTVYPPHFFDLEFTVKFACPRRIAPSPAIGVNR